MMIAGEFNTPADWLRTGNAAAIIDAYAQSHGGNAPVFVFVDSGGSFNNDTECVNGVRGNVADHLTKDVVPYVNQQFGTSADPADWGVVGWSMGGTCAVDLTVMHPELFSSFLDIAGDMGPNAGTKDQTIARLYGGNAAAWAQFDPTTVITKHGPYKGLSGWFAISTDAPTQHKGGGGGGGDDAVGLGGRDAAGNPGDQTEAANSLCALGRANGIDCAVVPTTGRHDWPLATNVFTAALPWLAGAIRTPGVPVVPLPNSGPPPATGAAPAAAPAPMGR
jgi:S-formylglutathione hydrolase FrmB